LLRQSEVLNNKSTSQFLFFKEHCHGSYLKKNKFEIYLIVCGTKYHAGSLKIIASCCSVLFIYRAQVLWEGGEYRLLGQKAPRSYPGAGEAGEEASMKADVAHWLLSRCVQQVTLPPGKAV